MLPPPRKVKPTVALKNIHSEQVSKLQAKHQQECDLLEDIRSFSSQRSKLEKEYAQGLLKLSSQLLKREFPSQPDIISEDGLEHKTACTVWRQILEETEKVAKARLQAAEIYMEKIAESAKPLKAAKVHCMKKVLPQLSTIQSELSTSVIEMTKLHKTYNVDETYTHEARQKSSEAEDKLKRKSTGLFQSLASLQKQCAKLKTRRDACEVKSTQSRNDYILALSAANAHQIRYYSTDMPDLTKDTYTVDGEVYEKIQEYFSILGSTVAEISQAESASFENIVHESAKISRAFSLQCFLFCNPVFTDLVQYQFEPCHNDPCNKVSGEYNAMPELEKEAKKWATKVAKETKAIREYNRIIKSLQNQGSDKVSDSGVDSNSTTASTTQDPEVKIEEMRQNIRKAETSKMKAEARLEALRGAGLNIDEYMSNAQMESLGTDDACIARTPSQMSLRTESSGGHSADDQPTYTHYDDDDDFIDDTFNTSAEVTMTDGQSKYPLKCKALYEFQASNYDELTIAAHEDLELVADGDGEGWVKARSSSGKTGYIPHNYVTFGNEGQNGTDAPSDEMSPPNSGGQAPAPPPSYPSEPMSPASTTDNQHDTTSSYSSGDLEVQQATDEMAVETSEPSLGDAMWARALYDYEAQNNEELSFVEGALIKVIRKDFNGVDDGYWEGEINGRTGVFPSLVVEELNADQEVMSPGMDYVPPPPVTVTMPTPDAELPPPPVTNGDGRMVFWNIYSGGDQVQENNQSEQSVV